MKVLIIGGYGRFGGNLARLLSDRPDMTFLIAGRNLGKAQKFCSEYLGPAVVTPIALQRDDIAATLQHEKPDLVVDASGPFQAYGQNPYHVAKACINAGLNYFDLSDSAEFVSNISELDNDALKKTVLILSGVSTCPALSGAVVKDLSKGMRVTDIRLGIAPSPKAQLGLSVVKTILSYAGTPLQVLRDGKITTLMGLAESCRYQITLPDYPPLENRRFSAVDAPELRLFPVLYPDLQNIWAGGGTRPEILLRILNGLAKLKASLNLPSLNPLAGLAHQVLNLCRFGPHRGGMFVTVKGQVGTKHIIRNWHLIAEGDDGPLIPAIAAEALIRKMLDGETLKPGARPATQELTLKEFEARFGRRRIFTSTEECDLNQPTKVQNDKGELNDV